MKFVITSETSKKPIIFEKIKHVSSYLDIPVRTLSYKLKRKKQIGRYTIKRFTNSEYKDYVIKNKFNMKVKNKQKGGEIGVERFTIRKKAKKKRADRRAEFERKYRALVLEYPIGLDETDYEDEDEKDDEEDVLDEEEEDKKEEKEREERAINYNLRRYAIQESAKREQNEEEDKIELERQFREEPLKRERKIGWNIKLNGEKIDTLDKLNQNKKVFIQFLDDSGLYSDRVLDKFRYLSIVDVYYNPEPKRYILDVKDTVLGTDKESFLLPWGVKKSFDDYKTSKYRPRVHSLNQYSKRKGNYKY